MNSIYLDCAATTPMRPEVREAMAPYDDQHFGNASSVHAWGRAARAALEEARERVAAAIGAQRSEVVFVRGGTESDNLAVVGRVLADRAAGRPARVCTVETEHRAVLDAARGATRFGAECTVLGVDAEGRLDLDELRAALATGASVASIMWVNNETGVVHDLRAIAELAFEMGVCLHTDAVQALGKLPVRVDDIPVGLLSLSGHKIEGPKGAAALFVRSGVELDGLLRGGGQEQGLRPGTPDVAGAVGLATAVELAVAERSATAERLGRLRDEFERRLCAAWPTAMLNGARAVRAPHVSSVGFPDVDPDPLLPLLDLEGLALSSGSACSSGSRTESHVLRALHGDADIPATLRFSFGRTTKAEEVPLAVERTVRALESLTSVASPAPGGSAA